MSERHVHLDADVIVVEFDFNVSAIRNKKMVWRERKRRYIWKRGKFEWNCVWLIDEAWKFVFNVFFTNYKKRIYKRWYVLGMAARPVKEKDDDVLVWIY
jgi:hypothetical protein